MRSLPVTKCRECPFLQASPLQQMFQIIIPQKSGYCGYHEPTNAHAGVIELGLPEGPAREDNIVRATRRMTVEDIDKLPPTCPLRRGDVTITVAS